MPIYKSKIRIDVANMLIDFRSLQMYNLIKEAKLIYLNIFKVICQHRKD